MFNKIRELAREALDIQNKIVMEEALKEIVLMCGEKAMCDESVSFPELEVQELNPLADIDESGLEVNAVEVPEEELTEVTEKPAKKGKK